MRQLYDVFERFPDGSTLWRACISGRFEATRRMQEFAEHSENDFYLMYVPSADFPSTVPNPKNTRPFSKSAAVG